MYVSVYVQMHHNAHTEVKDQTTFGSQFSSSTMCFPETELRLSGLVAVT